MWSLFVPHAFFTWVIQSWLIQWSHSYWGFWYWDKRDMIMWLYLFSPTGLWYSCLAANIRSWPVQYILETLVMSMSNIPWSKSRTHLFWSHTFKYLDVNDQKAEPLHPEQQDFFKSLWKMIEKILSFWHFSQIANHISFADHCFKLSLL